MILLLLDIGKYLSEVVLKPDFIYCCLYLAISSTGNCGAWHGGRRTLIPYLWQALTRLR